MGGNDGGSLLSGAESVDVHRLSPVFHGVLRLLLHFIYFQQFDGVRPTQFGATARRIFWVREFYVKDVDSHTH